MSPIFRIILVPHDLSERAAVAVVIAANLARVNRGRLIVLHVIPSSRGILDYPEAETSEGPAHGDVVTCVRRHLERRVTRCVSGRDAPPIECRVAVGDPATCILQAARGADAIVMPTLGRSTVVQVMVGSVAEQVVRGAPVPVLTIGPATIRRGGAAFVDRSAALGMTTPDERAARVRSPSVERARDGEGARTR